MRNVKKNLKSGNHILYLQPLKAGVAQLVEHDLAKVGVAGPSPVSRSTEKSEAIASLFLFNGLTSHFPESSPAFHCGSLLLRYRHKRQESHRL